MDDGLSRLSPEQRQLLAHWIPDATVLGDLSWGLVETIVVDLLSHRGRFIAKAGGPADGHIARELPVVPASCRHTATGSHATG